MTDGPLARLPPYATTGNGSLPYVDPVEALASMRRAALDLPCWPQLPRRSFLETMVPQVARAMPFLEVDEAARTVRATAAGERPARLARAWEWLLAGETSRFAPTAIEAAAWEPFLASSGPDAAAKGQLTGPVTLGLAVAGDDERPVFYDPELREAVVAATAAAARAQAEALGADRRPVILCADEPTLGALGTAAYLGVSRDDAVGALAATVKAIGEAGAAAAVHCCGAADWELVLEAGTDVVFADAFGFGGSLAAAARPLRGLLERGGRIAWGLVPTDAEHTEATVEEMLARHRETEAQLVRAGLDAGLLRSRSLLTPSCGCGSLDVPAAEAVFDKLRELRERLRERDG